MESVDKAYIEARVTKQDNGCWIWQKALSPLGYPLCQHNGKTIRVNRQAYLLWNGPIVADLYVCHTCDNRACLNPAHLIPGTPADNAADREMRKRNTYHVGSMHAGAKLTEADVLAIRASDISMLQLSKLYGVSHTAIHRIMHRVTWRHI